RRADHDALGLYVALPLPADVSRVEAGAAEVGHFAALRREDEAGTPDEARVRDEHGVERDLEAAAVQLPYVLELRRNQRRLGHGHRDQQVLGVLDVVLDAPGETVAQQAEVDGRVDLGGLLPLEVLVAIAARYDPAMWHVAPRVRGTGATRQRDQRGIRIDPRVALQPPAEPQPQVRERSARQELLLAEPPRRRQRGEGRPLVPDRELGRAVVAQHARHEEAVLEPHVGPPEKGRETTFCRARGGFERRGATEVVEAERIREEPDALGQHRVSRELAVFVAAHDVEAVAVAELALVRELRLDRL